MPSHIASGGVQVAGSLQGSSLSVTCRRFDDGFNSQFEDTRMTHTEFMYHTDVYMAYLSEDIVKHRKAIDEILGAFVFRKISSRSMRILMNKSQLESFNQSSSKYDKELAPKHHEELQHECHCREKYALHYALLSSQWPCPAHHTSNAPQSKRL